MRRVIAYEARFTDGKVELWGSDGSRYETDNREDLLDYMVSRDGDALKVCWELIATAAPILRLIGEERCRKLQATHKAYIPPFNCFYMPDKVFSVKHIPTKDGFFLYSLDKFYPNRELPDSVHEVKALGEHLLDELYHMGQQPTKLTSAIAIYRQMVLSHLDLPTLADIPKEAGWLAVQGSGKLWVEAYRLGYYKEAYSYDIVSSFPTQIMDLVDLRHLDFVHSPEYHTEAVYGYADGVVTIKDDAVVSPIIWQERGKSSTPTGTFPTVLTKSEIDFIRKWGIGDFVIRDAWWCIPKPNWTLGKPLSVPMAKLLKIKERGGMQAMIAKLQSVGVYGCFGEERADEFGDNYCPPYFAEVSTRVRLQVAEWLYRHNAIDKLLAVGVDGVLLDSPVDNQDWRWKLASVAPALIVSSGLVFTPDKEPKALSLETVLDAMRRHPRLGFYQWKLPRRVSLGDALTSGKFNSVGVERAMPATIDLYSGDHERVFDALPKSGGELLSNSYPSKPATVIISEGGDSDGKEGMEAIPTGLS